MFRQYFLFDLSIFFFNMYFTTILYYTGLKLLKRTMQERKPLIILNALYWVVTLLHLALFVASLFTN